MCDLSVLFIERWETEYNIDVSIQTLLLSRDENW